MQYLKKNNKDTKLIPKLITKCHVSNLIYQMKMDPSAFILIKLFHTPIDNTIILEQFFVSKFMPIALFVFKFTF